MVIRTATFTLLLSLFTMPALAGEVVVVLSGAKTLALKDGKSAPVGVYFNESMIPVMKLLDEKRKLLFVTPDGKPPYFDPSSDKPSYFKSPAEYKRAKDLLTELKISGPEAKLLSFKDLATKDPAEIDGVFVPGGHAPWTDLAVNTELGAFLRKAHDRKTPTGLICHGPIALLSTISDPSAFAKALAAGDRKKAAKLARGWPYRGYKMTIFGSAEEKVAEKDKLGGQVLYYPDDALKAAGGKAVIKTPWKPNVVTDRELVTGQNPASAEEFATQFAKQLKTRF